MGHSQTFSPKPTQNSHSRHSLCVQRALQTIHLPWRFQLLVIPGKIRIWFFFGLSRCCIFIEESSYIFQVALDMQLKRFVDWYSVSLSDLVEKAGGGKTWPKVNGLIPGIMKLFNSSPLLAFQSSYPQYYFFSWRFSVSPKNMWKDEYVLKRFIGLLASLSLRQ